MGILILIVVVLIAGVVIGLVLGYSLARRKLPTPTEILESRRRSGRAFMVGGGIVLILSLGVTLYSCWFITTARKTTGTITGMRERKDQDGSVSYAPTFDFRDAAGVEQRVDSQLAGSLGRMRVGDTVPILYQPDNPDNARIDYFLEHWFLSIGTSVAGVTLLAIGCWMVHAEKIKARIRNSLSQTSSGRLVKSAFDL